MHVPGQAWSSNHLPEEQTNYRQVSREKGDIECPNSRYSCTEDHKRGYLGGFRNTGFPT